MTISNGPNNLEFLPNRLTITAKQQHAIQVLGDTDHQITFRLVHKLVTARMNDEPEIDHRKALGERSPVLLKCYLHGMN